MIFAKVDATSTTTTLDDSDIIDGGAGSDMLTVTLNTVDTDVAFAGTLANVETLKIAAGAVTAAAAATLDITNAEVSGLETVLIYANKTVNLNFDAADLTDVVFEFDKLGAGTIDISATSANGVTLSLDFLSSVTVADISFTGDTGSTTVTTLDITMAGDLDFAALAITSGTAGATDSLLTVTVAGTGDIDLSSATAVTAATGLLLVDASALSGALTISLDDTHDGIEILGGTGDDAITLAVSATGVSVAGGSGDDTITAAASGTVSLEGGAGDDTIDISASDGEITSADVIDGGAGTDTIIIDIADAESAATLVNFENIVFVSTAATTIDASSFTAFDILGFSGTASVTNINGEVISIDGVAAASLTLGGDNVTRVEDSVTIDVTASSTGAAVTLAMTDIETVDINLIGVAATAAAQTTVLDVTITGATTVNIDVSGDTAATTPAVLKIDATITADTLNLTLDSAVSFTTGVFTVDALNIEVTGDSVDLTTVAAAAATMVSIDISGNDFASSGIGLDAATDVTIDISGDSNVLNISDLDALTSLLLTVSGDSNAITIADLVAASSLEIDLSGASFDGSFTVATALNSISITGDGSIAELDFAGAGTSALAVDLSGFSGSLTGSIDISLMTAYTIATITIGDVTGAKDKSANFNTSNGEIVLSSGAEVETIAFTSASASGLFNIVDFDSGEDVLDLSALGITKLNQLTFTAENAAADLLITSADGDFDFSIYLVGVTAIVLTDLS